MGSERRRAAGIVDAERRAACTTGGKRNVSASEVGLEKSRV